jgi:GT2 family glycosyltransferase
MTSTARPTQPDITLVIPTLGREILRECLESIERGTVWPAQVIVVDQGRRPEVGELLDTMKSRSFDTLWVPSLQTGRAAGVNRGIERAVTRFVAVTDDDCIVQADWLERVAVRLRERPDAIVTGRVEAGDTDTVLFVMTDQQASVQLRPGLRFDRLIGANMAIATDVINRLGGLDEDGCLRTAEDGEFAYRALRQGVPIVYAPDIVVTHLGWRDEHQRSAQYASYARSQGGFYGKYLRRGDWFIALRIGVHLLRSLRRWSIGTLRREQEVARIGRAYAVGLIPGILAGWRTEAGR